MNFYSKSLAFLAFIFLISYTLQSRDLRRFFEKNKLVKKQEQITNVLNTQNDSIVVVQMVTPEGSQND